MKGKKLILEKVSYISEIKSLFLNRLMNEKFSKNVSLPNLLEGYLLPGHICCIENKIDSIKTTIPQFVLNFKPFKSKFIKVVLVSLNGACFISFSGKVYKSYEANKCQFYSLNNSRNWPDLLLEGIVKVGYFTGTNVLFFRLCTSLSYLGCWSFTNFVLQDTDHIYYGFIGLLEIVI